MAKTAKKKAAKKAAKKKKKTLQRKTRAYVEWMESGSSYPVNHAFPADHDFVSLCGERFGGLNGGFRAKRCSVCKERVKAHVAFVKKEERAAWKLWLKNKERRDLMNKIAADLEDLDLVDLRVTERHLQKLTSEDQLFRHGSLCLPGLKQRVSWDDSRRG